ncbi:MAG: mechanosensitive ion channel family protein [Planctomycetota bacterium]
MPQSDTEQKVSEPEKPELEKPEPEKPVGIQITEISKRAQEDRITLNKISANLEPDAGILTIKEQLPSFLYSLKSLRSAWFYESLRRMTTRKLQELSQKWNIHLNKLNDWEKKLAKRTKRLEEDKSQLKEMDDLWQITRKLTIDAEIPHAIEERIEASLGQIKDIETRLLKQMNVSLTYRDLISEQQLEITKLIGLIQDAEVKSRKQLFVRDSPPLWKIFQEEGERLKLGSQILDSFANSLKMNMAYYRTNKGRLSLHIAIFAVLLGFMIYFYQRNKRNLLFAEKEDALKTSAFFLSCPFSTALLISIFFSIWIYSNAPIAVRELLSLLLLIPVLRLVRGIFSSDLCKPFYFLTGLFVLVMLEEAVGDHVMLQRLMLFLVTIIAVPLFAWWLRPGSQIYQIKSRSSYKLAISFSIFMLTILLASMVTDIIGVFPLGHVLVSGMMAVTYFSVVIYIVAKVLEGLVVLLIRRRSAQAFHIVQTYAGQLERNAIIFIHLLVYFVWLRMVLRTFGVYQRVWDWFSIIVEYKLALGTIEITVGAVFSFIIILVVSFVLARLVRIFMEMELFTRLRLPRGVPGAISMLVRYTIIGLGFFLSISAIGVDLGKFGLLAGAMGVGLGFGLRNIIENFVSGLILMFERPIQVGDTIEVGDVFGNVGKIGIRSSTVETYDGSEVIVPNASLISNIVSNWTMSNRQRRIQLPVKVAFGNDPHKVLELLHKVSREHSGVLNFPEPQAFFNGFGDNHLDFTLYYWISDKILQIKSEMALAVHDTIKNAGIDTPRPKGDFNLKIIDAPDKLQNKNRDDTIS